MNHEDARESAKRFLDFLLPRASVGVMMLVRLPDGECASVNYETDATELRLGIAHFDIKAHEVLQNLIEVTRQGPTNIIETGH